MTLKANQRKPSITGPLPTLKDLVFRKLPYFGYDDKEPSATCFLIHSNCLSWASILFCSLTCLGIVGEMDCILEKKEINLLFHEML